MLFAFYVGNDLGDSSRELTSSRHRIYFKLDTVGNLVQLPHARARSALSVWMNRHSRLYVWQKHHVNLLKSGLEEAMETGPEGFPMDDVEATLLSVAFREDAQPEVGVKVAAGEAFRRSAEDLKNSVPCNRN